MPIVRRVRFAVGRSNGTAFILGVDVSVDIGRGPRHVFGAACTGRTGYDEIVKCAVRSLAGEFVRVAETSHYSVTNAVSYAGGRGN